MALVSNSPKNARALFRERNSTCGDIVSSVFADLFLTLKLHCAN